MGLILLTLNMGQMGSCTLVVGGTGTGKTTFVKDRIKKVHKSNLYIYDVNNEYDIFVQDSLKNEQGEPLPHGDFLTLSKELKNSVVVFEESTIFFGTRSKSYDLNEMLVRKRHTNNTIFLVFHSMMDVPRYTYSLANYLVLFKTNDAPNKIDAKFDNEELTQLSEKIKASDNKHIHVVYKIY